MKTRFLLSAVPVMLLAAACTSNKVKPGTYVDLNTGETIHVIVDPQTGYAMNEETKKPVYLYVSESDTIFTTGENVNNKIIPLTDGKYEIDPVKVKVNDADVKVRYADYQQAYTIKDGDYKKKVEADGDIKIKDGDYKKKIEADGDVKIKTEDTKTKIEDGKAVTKERKKLPLIQ